MGAAWRFVKRFYWKAYEDNLTGLSGMVAYNMLLSVLPLGLLALFIAGRVLSSYNLEESVLTDLQQIFPDAAEATLSRALDRVQNSSNGIGIAAIVASIWIGSSFWGALDTAFCRIYHGDCRSWLRQKRFALLMLVVVLLFMAATVAVPTIQSVLVKGAGELPFGLSDVRGVIFALSLLASLFLLFLILCIIYRTVPNAPLPWAAIWPGALAATLAIGVVDYAFPLYLSSVNTVAQFGTTLVFILVVLLWFYVLAIIILGGATVNALHLEDISVAERAATLAPAAHPTPAEGVPPRAGASEPAA